MIDSAGIRISQGASIACERKEGGYDDNMSFSHYHDYFELYYLESGQRNLAIQDSSCQITAGQFAIFPPYVMHRSSGSSQNMTFRRIVLYFQPGQIHSEQLLKQFTQTYGLYLTDKKSRFLIHKILELLLAEETDISGLYREDYMNTLLNFLLITIQRQMLKPESHQQRTRIEQIVDYIHRHYQERISLEDLSGRFFVSPYHLCREFKRFTNRTIIQYTNTTRVMNAQRKIMETEKPMTEIAAMNGFSSPTHFNRVFKSIVGMSPTEYKKNYKNQNR